MPLCAICKREKDRGTFYHACDELWYGRLFICRDCRDNVAIQSSYHELCYECTEHLLRQGRLAFDEERPSRVQELGQAIRNMEKSHAALLAELPFTTDIHRDTHPGSLSPNLREWREKHRAPPASGSD